MLPQPAHPVRPPVPPPDLQRVAGEIEPDQHQPVQESAMQVRPQREDSRRGQRRPAAAPLQQPERGHRAEQGEDVRPGQPVHRTEHAGGDGGGKAEQRVHTRPLKKEQRQGIRRGDHDAGEHQRPRQPGEPVRGGEQHLAEPLVRHERLARHRVGEPVGVEQPALGENRLPDPEVAPEVAVGVDRLMAAEQGDREEEEDEHDVRGRGKREAPEVHRAHSPSRSTTAVSAQRPIADVASLEFIRVESSSSSAAVGSQ